MFNNEDMAPMMTAREVAHLLNVHPNTIRRWSDRGILKSYVINSRGDRRFRREDIRSFLEDYATRKPETAARQARDA